MLQVVSRFTATLNDTNENGITQLFEATSDTDVDSVRFLLTQDGILINKRSQVVYAEEEEDDEDDEVRYETPFHCAEQKVNAGLEDDEVLDDEVSRRIQVATLLRDAGGQL